MHNCSNDRLIQPSSPLFETAGKKRPMSNKHKELTTIVKLKNEKCGMETTIASCSSFRCCMNLESLPKNAKTSMFVVLSLLYGKLVVVACIAFVVSQELTKSIPLKYYEGFFTILFAVSIVFLMYLLCFLLQDSSCCPGKKEEKKKPTKKALKNTPKKKEKNKKESTESVPQLQLPSKRPNILQREVYPRKIKDKTKSKENTERVECSADNTDAEERTSLVGVGTLKKSKNLGSAEEKLTEPSPDSIDIEVSSPEPDFSRRKTSQNVHHYGSFFLRVGAIGFGLGTMIYIGLQFGQIFEIPTISSCYELLRVLNPILQMIFTFMQMYFIFMNARLKIHRFKFIARFGLMHVMATNICVWIKTLVYESLNEINRKSISYFNFSQNIVNTLSNEYMMIEGGNTFFSKVIPKSAGRALNQVAESALNVSKLFYEKMDSNISQTSHVFLKSTTTSPLTSALNTATNILSSATQAVSTTPEIITSTKPTNAPYVTTSTAIFNTIKKNIFEVNTINYTKPDLPISALNGFAEALMSVKQNDNKIYRNDSCGRLNIMGTIVEDAAPFLYPLVIEYSLIGAAVIFVMWRHIGRPLRYMSQENIEVKIEAILSQRVVALAQVQNGSRVDCVGASKGLFFGLLLLVGSLICMLLFFVLIHHQQFNWLAVYLADASHSVVMILSILAIIIGFCRAKNLKFYSTDTTDLNDILLRVSAFGLFIYATFGIIAGARYAIVKERNLLVLINGTITIFQVVLQLLFIGDMSKRHVYLPEHNRNKPGRQIVTFLLICNITMWTLFTFESQKVLANPVQLEFFGEKAWKLVEHLTLPLCIFHRFHSAVALAEIWKNSYKPRID